MNGERRAAHDAFVFARRLLLVFVAGILVVVGAMTADHIETVGTLANDISPTATSVQDTNVVTIELSMLAAGAAGESNGWSTADLVLLTCSIVALLVLLVHAFRAGPTVGSPQRRIDKHASHLLPAHVRFSVDGPDRLALCVIRTKEPPGPPSPIVTRREWHNPRAPSKSAPLFHALFIP